MPDDVDRGRSNAERGSSAGLGESCEKESVVKACSSQGTNVKGDKSLSETESFAGTDSSNEAQPVTTTSVLPSMIGRYRIINELGQGAFGTVYQGCDEELRRDVAIKVWRADRLSGNEEAEKLLEEARTLARLAKHPSIVGIHDVGRQDDGSCYVVLELIDGHPLRAEIQSHQLPLQRIVRIATQVASGIQHMHASGLFHRDLKPSNILLDEEGNASVADFGLALDEKKKTAGNGRSPALPHTWHRNKCVVKRTVWMGEPIFGRWELFSMRCSRDARLFEAKTATSCLMRS
jgi:serine/threonine protein kinase